MNFVNITYCDSYHKDELLKKISCAIELAGGIQLNDNKKIAIKINVCDARTYDTGAVTHPVFLDVLLCYLRDQFGDIPIYVLESDGTVVLADQFVKWMGYHDILKKWDAQYVNLSRSPSIVVDVNGKVFDKQSLPIVIRDSYFITLAKLKTNVLSLITCALKNQYGCMPMIDKNVYHNVLDRAIAELNTIYRPDFSIVDGIIGHGGVQGPAFGVPIPSGLIISGQDPVAVDHCCSKIMRIPPWLVRHIRLAAKLGVGSQKYELVGDPFKRVGFNVNLVEMLVFKAGGIFKRYLASKKRSKIKNINKKMIEGESNA